MWKRILNGFILIAVVGMMSCTNAGTSKLSADEAKKTSEKKVMRRGNFDESNEYSQPIHISSGVLQLHDSPEIHIDDHGEGLHEDILKTAPIWNSVAFGWKPIHKIIDDDSNEEHIHVPSLVEDIFSHGSSNEYPERSGLHTQIISSGGFDISHLNDKIDLRKVFNADEKHYIKSYG